MFESLFSNIIMSRTFYEFALSIESAVLFRDSLKARYSLERWLGFL